MRRRSLLTDKAWCPHCQWIKGGKIGCRTGRCSGCMQENALQWIRATNEAKGGS
ncbi:hypothetical protein EJ02DRAFT_256529 [Clathrospora elynae]|uniref:Uncharacterized protein n=1 Tax=Clathrospora elynae TaxID=706981 RepID=A0A6A5SQV3_9PLEO|nr:hypothetical protein EJ02DRAFT_256529 [Clathrospora elynae]